MKRLRSGVDYFVSSDGNELVIFPAYGNYSYTISKPFDLARKLMDQLSCPCDFEELSESITFQSNGAYQRKDVDSFLQFLTKEGLVVDINRNTMLSQDEQIRFERQTAYFEQSSSYPDDVDALQSRLLHKEIVIVGCGGVGAPIAELLVASGIGSLRLVDDDVVELGNLGRQIAYSDRHVGRRKVDALCDRLSAIRGKVRIESCPMRLCSDNAEHLLMGTDFAVVAADEPMPEIMQWIDTTAYKLDLAYICASNNPPEIRLGPLFRPMSGVRYAAYQNRLQKRWAEVGNYEQIANGTHQNKATTVWTCYAVASFVVGQIVQYVLTGDCSVANRSYLIDMESLAIREGVRL